MLQNKNEEIQKDINNNINSNNENIDIKNNNKNSNEISVSEVHEKSTNKNDEIIENLLSNINKNDDLQFKMNQSSETNSFENVKQDIINFYLIEKQKQEEKKKEIEINRNHNYNIKKNYHTNYNSRPHSVIRNSRENHFELYDKEKISYEIYHQYQKLSFNFLSIPFIQRMELYSLKRCLRDYKVEELTNLKSPKISEKEIVQAFNRLIEDSNRRLFQTNKLLETKESNEVSLNNKNINNNKKFKKKDRKKSFSKKKWDEIYEKRFISKEKERNNKLEMKRKEKEEKIKKEEDSIIYNLNKKQESYNKRYGIKRNNSENNLMKFSTNSLNNKYYIGNSKIVTNLNQRLYYNEINKKDIYYKSFLEKAYELLDDNEYNYKNLKKGKKKNYFRKKMNAEMKKDNHKRNAIYNFIDFDEKNENKEEEKNNNNFTKIIKDLKENIDSRLIETSGANNSKIEITGSGVINTNNKGSAEKIIDRFFEN